MTSTEPARSRRQGPETAVAVRMLTMEQFAQRAGCSVRNMYRLRDVPGFPAARRPRPGAHPRYREDEVDAFLRSWAE